MRCPRCGKTFDALARFCTEDGARLAPDGEGVAAAPVATPGVAPDVPAGAPPSDLSKLTGRVLDGRYRVSRKVGEGGMAYVYEASDVRAKERVAIKVLTPRLSTDRNAMARLRREASLGSRLSHPNVCHIIRLGESADGLVYIVMPFVEGELLCDRTYRVGHLPLDQTVALVAQIAAGLHAAHELGIVHRDLKPENIMLCAAPDGSERAVVMDFGLAKERRVGAEVEKLTATGIVLGTPEFMSPEQLRGKPLDARTDVYALALITYEMLSGRLPFEGQSQQEVMIARLRGEPVPLRKMRPELALPAAVERVLEKCLARDADKRYQTAPEFASALSAAATDPTDRSVKDRLLHW